MIICGPHRAPSHAAYNYHIYMWSVYAPFIFGKIWSTTHAHMHNILFCSLKWYFVHTCIQSAPNYIKNGGYYTACIYYDYVWYDVGSILDHTYLQWLYPVHFRLQIFTIIICVPLWTLNYTAYNYYTYTWCVYVLRNFGAIWSALHACVHKILQCYLQ